jgi:hypothetical protein
VRLLRHLHTARRCSASNFSRYSGAICDSDSGREQDCQPQRDNMRFDGPARPPPANGVRPFCDPATIASALALMTPLGWLFGLALRSGITGEAPVRTRTTNRLLARTLFSRALAAIFVAELIWNLW